MHDMKQYLSMGLAVIFAFASSIGVYHYLRNREPVSIASTEPVIPVVIARHDLPMGMKLSEQDVTVRQWPKSVASDSYFHHAKQVIGRTTRGPLIADEPLTEAKLLGDGENLANLIPAGMRAVAIQIRKSKSMVRMLERGTEVDVIAVLGDSDTTPRTKVIAQAARVLAVESFTDAPGHEKDSRFMEVTLLVSPGDAEWIVFAMNKGIVELALRNNHKSARSPDTEVFYAVS